MPCTNGNTSRTAQAALAAALAVGCLTSILLVVAVHLWWSHRLRTESAATSVRSVAQCLAAHAAVVIPPEDAKDAQQRILDAQRWVAASAVRLGAVAIALIDFHGRVLAAHPTELRFQELYAQCDRTRLDQICFVLDRKPPRSSRCLLASATVSPPAQTERIGSLVIVVPENQITPRTRQWTFCLALVIVFFAVWSVTFLSLRRTFVLPLRALAALSEDAGDKNVEHISRTTREVARIAGLFKELADNANRWHSQASYLKHTVETRVAARTREVTSALRRAEALSGIDPLTGCWNRRVLEHRLQDVVSAQRDEHRGLALVMFDVDNFKQINDTLGHKTGDELLAFFGVLLRNSAREEDLAVRYGGDEFLLILVGATGDQAVNIVSRILALFRQRASLFDIHPKPSISAGIASLDRHETRSADELLRFADAALYEAKLAGKATVRCRQPVTRA
jgi:diguanylate cyclase (GGDEF)-like protein